MTQPLAYWVAGTFLCILALDVMLFGSDHLIITSKHFLNLIHWMAFWR